MVMFVVQLGWGHGAIYPVRELQCAEFHNWIGIVERPVETNPDFSHIEVERGSLQEHGE